MILDFRFWILDFVKRFWLVALVGGALIAALAVTYYCWKAEIRHAAQAELLNQQQAAEIAKLRAGAEASEAESKTHEARIQELSAEVQKSEVRSQKLAADFAAAVEREKKARAEIAQLRPAEVVKRAEDSGFRIQDAATGRKVLDLIADRDGCREELGISEAQNKNCEDRNSIFDVQRSELLSQVGDLKTALDLEKRAFEQRDDLAKKQVSAAKGSWLARIASKAKWFAVGVTAGAVAGAIATR